MLRKIEVRKRSGWQRRRWLDGITESVDISLSKLWETVEGQGSLECCSPWGHKESDVTEWPNNNVPPTLSLLPRPWHSAKSSFLPYIHWNYCESGQHVDPFTQENSWALLLTAPHPLFWVEKAELRTDPFPWKEWPIAGLPFGLPDVFWSWLCRHITGWPWTGCSSRGLPLFIHKLLQQACVQAGRRAGGQVGD